MDYNPEGGMNNQLNALTSLFFRRNYKKFFEEHHINISNSIDIANGLYLHTAVGLRNELMLGNYSDYSFFYNNTRDYTLNLPVYDAEALAKNLNNRETYFKLGLEYTPQYYYKVWGGKKHYQHSKYPTLFLNYRKAVKGVAGSDASYDFLEIGAQQKKEWGMMHSFTWYITAGSYLTKDKLFLSDYKFFNNQPLPVIFGSTKNSFYLPGLYENYTNKNYVEGHVTFTTPYLLLKYIPFISDKMWLENIQVNYLYTKQLGHYWEAGYCLSQIYAVGGIGIYAGFNGTQYQSAGVRFVFGF
ncbi:MAG: hypothetical protein HC831_24130 [Chloroflexia bacterium]|nr:hypothetical protein [Chloroflexia bacterium]